MLLWMATGGGALAPIRSAFADETGAVVRCDPLDPSSRYDTDVDVNVYVENVVDLYGADVKLSFDTTLAQIVDANTFQPGVQVEPLGSLMAPDFVLRQDADNAAGTIWYAATQTNPTLPANGSGPLVRLTFHPLSYGSFTLAFTSADLVTRHGVEITSTTQNCLVNFTTPLPTTTGLSPSSALANSGAFTLTVSGTNFVEGAVVYWGGAPRTTTYLSGTELQASLPASDLATAGPVSVTVVNPAPGGGESNPQTFTVSPQARFSAAAYDAGEAAGSAPVDVVLSAPSTLTVTVAVSSTNGTATLADYSAVSQTVTFAPGVVTQTVNVALTADALVEPPETVLLDLSEPVNAVLGSPAAATLTILDDTSPLVSFASAAYTAAEAAGTVPITVSLSAPAALTVTVNYTATNGTAQAGPDYAAASGTLTFTPGQSQASFNLALVADTLDELDETVLLALGQPVNAVLGPPASAVLTIVDDDFSYKLYLPTWRH